MPSRGRNATLIRVLSILRVFEGGGRYTYPQLAERFSVTERTIIRDIQALEAAGVPLRQIPGDWREKTPAVWWLLATTKEFR